VIFIGVVVAGGRSFGGGCAEVSAAVAEGAEAVLLQPAADKAIAPASTSVARDRFLNLGHTLSPLFYFDWAHHEVKDMCPM
jgi:hypothetical protein